MHVLYAEFVAGVTAGAWHAQRRLASTHVNIQRLHYFHFGSEKVAPAYN